MKFALALIFILVATIAEAACPVGSTCENYQGQIPYISTNPSGSTARTPADRVRDHGVNILDFGATRNSLTDSSAAIQSAIDACYNTTGCRNIYCPDGYYGTTQSIFLDPPNSLRGGAPWVATTYQKGDIVIQSGTYYRSTANNNSTTPPSGSWASSPAVLYSSGATYATGDTVLYNGVMWISLANSNTGNQPNTSATKWKMTIEKGNLNQNWGATFAGDFGAPSAAVTSGCRIFVGGSANFAGIWISGNNMVVDGVNLIQQSSIHRCQLDQSLIGFAVTGGATSNTTVRNSSVSGFYAGYETAANGDANVGDSNFLERVDFSDVCYGAWFAQTQNFINTIVEGRISGRYSVVASQNNGVNIYGGNYSSPVSAVNTFTISSVTMTNAGGPPVLTATLASNGAGTWPDTSLTGVGCDSTRTDYPLGCNYDMFVVITPSFGAIPFLLRNNYFNGTTYSGNGFNQGTNQITLQLYMGFIETWDYYWINSMISEVQAATVMYAAEVSTPFTTCGGNVQGVHIENPETPTMIINAFCSFGLRGNWYKDLYLDEEPSSSIFANQPAMFPVYIVQNLMPFFSATTDLHIDGINVSGVPRDRLTYYGSYGVSLTMDHSELLLNLKTNVSLSQSYTMVDPANTLSTGIGSRGTGIVQFGPGTGGGSTASITGSFADIMRGGTINTTTGNVRQQAGFGVSPFWGVRPAPYTTPCVTSGQFANIPPTGTLPAITTVGAGFTGSLVGSTGILTVSSSTGLATNQIVYGTGIGFQITLGSQIDSTHWNTNASTGNFGFDTTRSSQPMSTMVFSVPYPLLWGGQNYRVCDGFGTWTRNMTIGNSFYSAHKFYSYGQSINSTLIPALAWSLKRSSPALYLDPSTMQLVFPGLILQLTCNSLTKDEMIVEVNQILGYVRLMDAVQDGTPYVSDFGQDCVGGSGSATLTIGQPAYAATAF